jgi:hypothetical protein
MERALQAKAKEWAKIVARAWVDETFKQKLLAQPLTVLKDHGIDVPAGTNLMVVEAVKSDTFTLVLPPKPREMSGSVEDVAERLAATAPALAIPWGVAAG